MSAQPPSVPFRWRLRWFCQGVGSIFGIVPSPEQTAREIRMCAEEMLRNDPNAEQIVVTKRLRNGEITCEFVTATDFPNHTNQP